jgi:hypothetical protein
MQRQAIGDGRWFDLDAATKFEEARRHDGRNYVSLATGDQWEHEALYRTKGGKWILSSWSQRQGTRETWDEVTAETAALWLVRNEHEAHPACAEEYAALEVG